MMVWIVEANCGDYYCDGDHTVAVYTTRELAEHGAAAAENMTESYNSHPEPRRLFKKWSEIEIVEYTLDETPPVHKMYG